MLWDSLHKVYTQLSYPFMKCNDFWINRSYHAMTLTFDPLTLKVCGRSGVTWSQSVVNLIEIEQSPAELLII